MYYLISEKSNIGLKIISDKDLDIQEQLKDLNDGWDADRLIRWMYGYISKSNNVFDLIEKGDLIRINLTAYPDDRIKPIIKFVDDMIFKGIHSNEDIISAIYKPDSKGNFIKVWESKEEDNLPREL